MVVSGRCINCGHNAICHDDEIRSHCLVDNNDAYQHCSRTIGTKDTHCLANRPNRGKCLCVKPYFEV